MKSADELLKKLPDDWDEQLIKLYSQGMSDAEVRRAMKISPKAWAILYFDSVASSFQEIVEYGRDLAQAWWESKARQFIDDKALNTPLFIAVMQNRFDWTKDKKAPEEPPELDLQDIDEKLQRYFAAKTD